MTEDWMKRARKQRDEALMEKDHRIMFENNGGKKKLLKIFRNEGGVITTQFLGNFGTRIHGSEDSLLIFLTDIHFLLEKYYILEVSKELEPLVNNFIYALDVMDKYFDKVHVDEDKVILVDEINEEILDVLIRLYSNTFRDLAEM